MVDLVTPNYLSPVISQLVFESGGNSTPVGYLCKSSMLWSLFVFYHEI